MKDYGHSLAGGGSVVEEVMDITGEHRYTPAGLGGCSGGHPIVSVSCHPWPHRLCIPASHMPV